MDIAMPGPGVCDWSSVVQAWSKIPYYMASLAGIHQKSVILIYQWFKLHIWFSRLNWKPFWLLNPMRSWSIGQCTLLRTLSDRFFGRTMQLLDLIIVTDTSKCYLKYLNSGQPCWKSPKFFDTDLSVQIASLRLWVNSETPENPWEIAFSSWWDCSFQIPAKTRQKNMF